MNNKTEKVFMACLEVERELENNNILGAELKLMNLCIELANGTKYKKLINDLSIKYSEEYKNHKEKMRKI